MVPLSAEDIRDQKFPTVLSRGYDRAAVDEFVAKVADDYAAALQKIASAAAATPLDDIGAEVASVLQTARESADLITERARKKAKKEQDDAARRAEALTKEAEKTRTEAQQFADDKGKNALENANKEAGQIRHDAQRASEQMLADARRKHKAYLDHEDRLRSRIAQLDDIVKKLGALLSDEGEPKTIVLPKAASESVAADVAPVWRNEGSSGPGQKKDEIWDLQESLRGARKEPNR